MINGLHAMIFSSDPDADRAFFRDVLRFPHVDAGHGWLIFAAPPAEIGFHEAETPTPGSSHHELYLMCDDINATVADLKTSGVRFTSEIADQGWGLITSLRLPGGSDLALYQPRHPRPAQSR